MVERWLQWSHVFSDMVRIVGVEGNLQCVGASMEPCLFRHGKERGKREVPAPDTRLQWSHVFSDMVRARPGTARLR